MNLFEFEGKKIFSKYNIPIPNGKMLYDTKEDFKPEYPCVVKAQVLTGGRGKAGGIKICKNREEFLENSKKIMDLEIKGHKVRGLLREEVVDVKKEIYISITLQGVSKPTLIISESGGIDIENVAKNSPEKIIRIEIDPFVGIKDYQIKYIQKNIRAVDKEPLKEIIRKLERLFFEMEAILVEINPLGVLHDGSLIAMDSKVVLDDYSKKSESLAKGILENRKNFKGYKENKEESTITFVPINESGIGLISDGAGTGMLTLDLLTDAGGQIASFCELGGITPPETMYRAMDLTYKNCKDLKSIFIVLIGGFNRMDDMAVGITKFLSEHNIDIPVFTRMCGTKEEEGIKIMKEAGLKTYYDLNETVLECVNFGGKEE